MKHCPLNGFRNFVVKTVDTDIMTLVLAHLSIIDSTHETEVDFNFGNDRIFIKANDVCPRITQEQQLKFMFVFAFTCCNIKSLFFSISKSKVSKVWHQIKWKNMVSI